MTRVKAAPVCVIELTYTAELDAVDAHMKPHFAWLEAGVAEGVLLLAGRQVPRTGGIILCRGRRAEVEAYAASDPFVIAGVATSRVTELAVSIAAKPIANLFE